MPSTIPYDPSLAIGNIVDPTMINNMVQISTLQGPAEAALDELNSFILLKRSLDMTISELIDMGVDSGDMVKTSGDVSKNITAAATDYAKKRVASELAIQPIKALMRTVHSSFESPIDYNKSKITSMQLSFDSFKMDAQYFSFDENKQESNSTMSNIKSFVSRATSQFGNSNSSQSTNAVTSQITSQRENHDVAGTLIICATCTHKDAAVLAPFILDVDKAIRVWNSVNTAEEDKITISNPASIIKIASEEGTAKEKFLPILSGATFGSSFIGMVHVLKQESTTQHQEMMSTAESLQTQFEVACWFKHESGGDGTDKSFSNDVKNLLSKSSVTSHITLYTMGVIPSIAANPVKTAIKEFSNFDGATIMEKLSALQANTATEQKSVAASASAARTGSQMLAMEGANITNVMLAASTIENESNRILDTNSLMTAFEDYIKRAGEGAIGVPINYYVKNISRAQLAQMWVAKYFPGKYISIQGDDSERPAAATQ